MNAPLSTPQHAALQAAPAVELPLRTKVFVGLTAIFVTSSISRSLRA